MTLPSVLILGGGSDIGLAIARRFAAAGHGITLAARWPESLEPARSDIALRHDVEVGLARFDACNIDAAEGFFEALAERPGIVVSVVGLLGDQDATAADPALARQVAESNFLGPAWALEVAARRLAETGGTVIGISSVAGDRGRARNYWYGAAKAGLSAVLSGLRQKYAGTGLHVITVKPGFVATRMTEGMDLPKALTASPEEVGKAVYDAWKKRRDTVYTRGIWRLVMAVICALPETVFKKTRF